MTDTIGERIRQRRQTLNMSQDYLAKLTGYQNRATISMIENNVCDVPRKKVPLFAAALGVSVDYLNGYENSKAIQSFIDEHRPKTEYDILCEKIGQLSKSEQNSVAEYVDFIISKRE